MDKYFSITRSIPVLIFASFGLIASPDVSVLAATGKFNPEPNSMALDILSETELDNLSDADAAYVKALREHFD
ncbi:MULTISPECIES: hypothetical protein [Fischerella]|uniref:Uncharacterized protein n=1 Tax=Fischerella muscicola CCMEE 5323 TaxID=2019572 RepID=A0A2N6K833_FISMU|nr:MULTISPECIES: hypothetical protein [Fischerella]MBD2435158.1 hypothetical protein [Fischerella sp. FACHB-380]PLZ93593.1 hypothetical protein CEN44_02830 [Fischerella muscicola CCMEE 5323]